MRIAIADPGLKNASGHHFDWDLVLVRALRGRVSAMDVFAYRKVDYDVIHTFADDGARVLRGFPIFLHDEKVDGVRPVSFRDHVASTHVVLPALDAYDLVFWPTLSAPQMTALAERPPRVRTVGALHGQFKYLAHDDTAMSAIAAGHLAAIGAPVHFGCFDFRVAQICAPWLHPLPIYRLPAPVDGPRTLRRRQALTTLGFAGAQRRERGLDDIPALASALLDHGFHIRIQDADGQAGLGMSDPKLTVTGFVETFADEVDACDAILWPSDSAAYSDRASGVTAQSIACGVPIIMPSQGLPARTALALGAPAFFHRPSVESIIGAALWLRDNYASLEAQAHARAQQWTAREGSARLANALLAPTLPRYGAEMGV